MTSKERIKRLEEEIADLQRIDELESQVAALKAKLAPPVAPWYVPMPYPVYPAPYYPTYPWIYPTYPVITSTGTLTITDGNVSTSNTVYQNVGDEGTAMGGVVQNPSPFAPTDGSTLTFSDGTPTFAICQ